MTGPACTNADCGKPQEGAGRPRKGWVRINIAGRPPAIWFCSPDCAMRALGRMAGIHVAGRRDDVATCQACITRHDLDHACRSCGHRPPARLFHNLGRPE